MRDTTVEPTLERYAALASQVRSLLREPEPESLDAPPPIRRLLTLGVYRLALYVSAMPGAQAQSCAEIEEMRAQGESIDAGNSGVNGDPRPRCAASLPRPEPLLDAESDRGR